MISLRELWNATLAEPVPQHLIDVLEGAAALTGTERGECSPENNGDPNGEPDSREIPRPGEAPHNRFPVKTAPEQEGSGE